MCLIIKEGQLPEVATADIVCYKFVVCYNPDTGGITRYMPGGEYVFRTPYRDYRIEIGSHYTATLSAPVFSFHPDIEYITFGLHSFDTIRGAMRAVEHSCLHGNCVIVECIIPKGSTYYVGSFSRAKSYASDQIIYKQIINK